MVGTDGNKFLPRCQCMSGFKSSAPGGAMILEDGDVCIPCLDGACEKRPTASPTAHPTVSAAPSSKPTISASPTLKPTTSTSPSISPTTSKPSLKPTLSTAPSLLPSDRPSSYGSLYDGENCKSDWQCATFVCSDITNKCGGKVCA